MRERRAIEVEGIVQGVGFRPFVHGLAVRWRLSGFVRNQAGSVQIEVEGPRDSLDQFRVELEQQAPRLARIERIESRTLPPCGEAEFRIESSLETGPGSVFISPDVAPCDACLAELFDPTDRRFRYPFLNCTQCGPRLTIITGAPYDRPHTTMAEFSMCPACRAEYDDPSNRRFHAQPIACPACGPRVHLHGADGDRRESIDPIADFAAALCRGAIGALKGLGGYHLVCDATNASAVGELRRRKQRDAKPFAVMIAHLAAAEALVELTSEERELLDSPRRPIVLLRRRSKTSIVESVAPGNPWLGLMLPYTPLHHLLLRAVGGLPLVMTSGNRASEPIAYRDETAFEQLAGMVDLFLTHDRPIHVRCDDSVTRIVAGAEMPLRRSRGDAPQPIELPIDCSRAILATGGQQKGTFALGRGRQAFLSHHLGDLDHVEAYRAFVRDIELYERLFAIRPQVIVHDLHPDYASTLYARERASREGIALRAVQHHHAHMASCMAEHGLSGEVIGVTFDGTGYGLDGTIWGGEFLVGGYDRFRRGAHLRPIGMPGGERAIRHPWRMAAAYLQDAGLSHPALEARQAASDWRIIAQMLERGLRCPLTSSMGRLFDAVASLVGLADVVHEEGQAAMQLEWLAASVPADGVYPFELIRADPAKAGDPWMIDLRPLITSLVADTNRSPAAVIARRFHSTVIEMIAVVCERLRNETGLSRVVFGGGVFLNALLTEDATHRLRTAGFHVYRPHRVPPSDAGLSLGQLAVGEKEKKGTF